MADVAKHVIIGDFLGELVDRIPDERINRSFLAFVLAFGTHALMDRLENDCTPDWTRWMQDARNAAKDAPYLTMQIGGIAASIIALLRAKDAQERETRIAGMLGSIAPDVIDGIYSLMNKTAWERGKLLMPWHRAGRETGPRETAEQTSVLTGVLSLLRLSVRF